MSPFDSQRYARLLEGLDISEVAYSSLEFTGRLDAEYYSPVHLKLEAVLAQRTPTALANFCRFLIGPFGSAFTAENYTEDRTYRYIRGKDVKPSGLADIDNVYMPKADYVRLSKYALEAGDVLTSVVATVGNSALVEHKHLPAIFSCKSTALRPTNINPKYLISFLNSKFGKSQLKRKERGAIQKGLNLDDLKTLLIFDASSTFQTAVSDVCDSASSATEEAKAMLLRSEQVLLDGLNLGDWGTPDGSAYVKRCTEVFAVGRLDAEYFTPRVTALMALLGKDRLTLADVAPARHDRFLPKHASWPTFQYIEIGDVRSDGSAEDSLIQVAEAPSRATQIVRAGDVLTSTVRPIRRLSAVVADTQDKAVCSSGFVVLGPQSISADTLLTYLRLPLFCELMDLHTSASLYPAIAERDLMALPIPRIPSKVQAKVDAAMASARAHKQKSAALLHAAQQAVEMAIDKSEAEAMAYLQQATKAWG